MQNAYPQYIIPEFSNLPATVAFDNCVHLQLSRTNVFDAAFGQMINGIKYLPSAQDAPYLAGKTVYVTSLMDPVVFFLNSHNMLPCANREELNLKLKNMLDNIPAKQIGPGYIVENTAAFCNIPQHELKALSPQQQIDSVLNVINQTPVLLIAIEESQAESLFMLARLCGKNSIPVVPPLQQVPLEELLEEKLKQRLENTLAPSVMLYRAMKQSLENQLNPLFGDFPKLNISLARYKQRQQTLVGSLPNISVPKKRTRPDFSNLPKFTIPEFEGISPQIKVPTVFTHPDATGAGSVLDTCEKILPAKQIYHPPGGSFKTGYDDFASLGDDEKKKLRFIFGHRNFGVHLQMPVECAYATLLRDPVSVFISNYFYAWRRAVDYGTESHVTQFDSFEKWIDHNLAKRSGSEALGYIPHGFAQFDQPWVTADSNKNLAGLDSETTLEMTCKNLDMHYMVGITELFEQTLFVLAWFHGWHELPFWERRNRTRNRPEKHSLPPFTIRKIERIQGMSVRIYGKYRAHFEEQFKQLCDQFPGLEKTLQRYKQESAKLQ